MVRILFKNVFNMFLTYVLITRNNSFWGDALTHFSICLNGLISSIKSVYVCLFGVFRPTLESFTHFETSLLPA